MAGQCGTWRRHLTLADNALRPGVPVPQQNGAIGRTAGNVTVRCDVTFGPGQTGDDAKVTEDDLYDLGRIGGEDAETVVPETASEQETTVHGGDETIGTDP